MIQTVTLGVELSQSATLVGDKKRHLKGSSVVHQQGLINQFKRFYGDFSAQPLDIIDDIYGEDVLFRDPLHQLRGRDSLQRYFHEVSHNLNHCRFEFINEVISNGIGYFHWTMHYSHPSIKQGQALTLNGVTQIRYTEKITHHEDFYDMGAMLYQHLPIIGWAVRKVNKRLTDGSST